MAGCNGGVNCSNGGVNCSKGALNCSDLARVGGEFGLIDRESEFTDSKLALKGGKLALAGIWFPFTASQRPALYDVIAGAAPREDRFIQREMVRLEGLIAALGR